MAVRTSFTAGEVLAAADLTDTFGSKVDYALPVNAQTGTTYTFVLADANKLTSASNAAAVTLTIPPQSSVTWLANSVIRVVNYGAGAVTVDGGSGVTVTNTATTVAQFSSAAAIRTAEDAWTLVPFSGGSTGFQQFEYLVVAGGASGGGAADRAGGGGGAGGFKTGNLFLESGSFTVTVGAGGAATSSDVQGNDGSASVFSTISTTGGGGGGSGGATQTGKVGGSGGGGGATNADATFAGGSGTSGEGNAGGAGRGSSSDANNQTGGGGGGASAVGGDAGVGGPGGNGGAGTASSITGSSVTYAGGGGGGKRTSTSSAGTGGAGGGGDGEKAGSGGTAGTVNTGGGGGGAGASTVGKAGGSGIVVLKVVSSITLNVGVGLTSSSTTAGGYNIYTFTAGTGTVTF
jgi:hypothetical protein